MQLRPGREESNSAQADGAGAALQIRTACPHTLEGADKQPSPRCQHWHGQGFSQLAVTQMTQHLAQS